MTAQSAGGVSSADLLTRATSDARAVVNVLSLLGDAPDKRFLDAYIKTYGEQWVDDLLNTDGRFVQALKVVAGRANRELFELLLVEHLLCARPKAVSSSLNDANYQVAKTIHTLRGNVALGLYEQAKSLSWREPISYARALRVAETYLDGVVENWEMSNTRSREQFRGRLGVTLVLQGRYIETSLETKARAVDLLEASTQNGNNSSHARAYLCEAYLRLWDATRDDTLIRKLLTVADSNATAQLTSLSAEAWMRRAEIAQSAQVRELSSDKADACLRAIRSSNPTEALRKAVLLGVLRTRRSQRSLTVVGLNAPFGMPRFAKSIAERDPRVAVSVMRNVVAELLELPPVIRRSTAHRRLEASLRTSIAQIADRAGIPEDKWRELEAAVNLRSKSRSQAALVDPESRLQNTSDLFNLYQLTGREGILVRAIKDALALIDFNQAWPLPALMLARQARQIDGPLSLAAAREIRDEDYTHARRAAGFARNGDAAKLFAMAAEAALQSRELARRPLGGRTGVYLAEDYTGLLSDTFVFKPTVRHLADAEVAKAERIRARIAQAGKEDAFAVASTLAISPLPAHDPTREQTGYDVIVAREFHAGRLLDDVLLSRDLADACTLLSKVAEFLALIHTCSSSMPTGLAPRLRSELRKKEVGYWLRQGLRISDHGERFETWMNLFDSTLPSFERRDAHALNWIVADRGQITALDFEAKGWRPVGYELAQLIDDVVLLPIDDSGWNARLQIVGVYRLALQRAGEDIAFADLRHAFEVSLCARMLRNLTAPDATKIQRDRSSAMLTYLSEHAKRSMVRSFATQLRVDWEVRSGTASVTAARGTISLGRRRHLSRAMAFELRHGEHVMLHRGGWAYVAALLDAMRASGLRLERSDLINIASAIDEPRFELDGMMIRARYGHTRDVSIDYDEIQTPPTLYHGTTFGDLDAIIQNGEGLRPMRRQWVHTSSDRESAIRTARRHGPVALLAIDPQRLDASVLHAGGTVYLMKHVPAEALRVVTPAELFTGTTSAELTVLS